MEALGRNALTTRFCCLFIRFDGQTVRNSRDIRRSRNRDGSSKLLNYHSTDSPWASLLNTQPTPTTCLVCTACVCLDAVVIYLRSVGKGKSGKVGGKSGKVGATEGDSKSQSRSSKAGRTYRFPLCLRCFSLGAISRGALVPQSSSPSAVSTAS